MCLFLQRDARFNSVKPIVDTSVPNTLTKVVDPDEMQHNVTFCEALYVCYDGTNLQMLFG